MPKKEPFKTSYWGYFIDLPGTVNLHTAQNILDLLSVGPGHTKLYPSRLTSDQESIDTTLQQNCCVYKRRYLNGTFEQL